MKMYCAKCNEFMFEADNVSRIDVRCPVCNHQHTNMMYKNYDSIEIGADGNIKPPEIATYVKGGTL